MKHQKTETIDQGLAQQAPDFWSWRGGVFEFDQPMAWQVSDPVQRIEHQPESTPAPLADPIELEQQIAALQAEDPGSPLLDSLYQSLGETYRQRLEQGMAANRPRKRQRRSRCFKPRSPTANPLPTQRH